MRRLFRPFTLPSTLACFLTLALFGLGSATGQAQNQYDLSRLAPGQVLLNLSTSEEMEVDQDTLNATLQYTAQGKDKTALQEEVNQAMRQALDILSAASDVEYNTGQYHVFIQHDRRPSEDAQENPVWRAQQSLEMTGTNNVELLELAGRLQEAGLHITSLAYSLSPDQYAITADALTRDALASLQLRAEQAAHALERSQADLVEVSLEDSGNIAHRRDASVMAMSAAEARAATPPVAEPGTTTVRVTVSARALLSP